MLAADGDVTDYEEIVFCGLGEPTLRLEAIVEERVRAYADRYPPPNESVYRAETRDLHRTARMFLAEEARRLGGGDRTPRFLEASLGMPSDGPGTPLDRPDPIPVTLPGGVMIRARGRIDRVDAVAGGQGPGGRSTAGEAPPDGSAASRYVILDYKTGSDSIYELSDPFRGGRRAQPWLYLEMARTALREGIGPGCRVERFSYFFPAARAAGARYEWTADRLAEGGAHVEALCALVAAGGFTATDDAKEDCTFCECRPICGDVDAIARSAEVKAANPENGILEPFRRLRHGERPDGPEDTPGPGRGGARGRGADPPDAPGDASGAGGGR